MQHVLFFPCINVHHKCAHTWAYAVWGALWCGHYVNGPKALNAAYINIDVKAVIAGLFFWFAFLLIQKLHYIQSPQHGANMHRDTYDFTLAFLFGMLAFSQWLKVLEQRLRKTARQHYLQKAVRCGACSCSYSKYTNKRCARLQDVIACLLLFHCTVEAWRRIWQGYLHAKLAEANDTYSLASKAVLIYMYIFQQLRYEFV